MDAHDRILDLMAQRSWSANRLIRESNLSHSLIYNMVRRNNLPTITTLSRVSAAFGLSLQQFFTEDDDPAALSGEQAALLILFHNVPAPRRQIVLRLMELMAEGNRLSAEEAEAAEEKTETSNPEDAEDNAIKMKKG